MNSRDAIGAVRWPSSPAQCGRGVGLQPVLVRPVPGRRAQRVEVAVVGRWRLLRPSSARTTPSTYGGGVCLAERGHGCRRAERGAQRPQCSAVDTVRPRRLGVIQRRQVRGDRLTYCRPRRDRRQSTHCPPRRPLLPIAEKPWESRSHRHAWDCRWAMTRLHGIAENASLSAIALTYIRPCRSGERVIAVTLYYLPRDRHHGEPAPGGDWLRAGTTGLPDRQPSPHRTQFPVYARDGDLTTPSMTPQPIT